MTLQDNGESILLEAQKLTHGDRNKDYGHPLDDYTRTAAIASALLSHKLKEPITAEEMATLMIGVKLSRHMHAPKRDNMVDAAGYAWVAWACHEETERRSVPAQVEALVAETERVKGPLTPDQKAYAANAAATYFHPELDPRPRCAVHSTRIAPVIGCSCTMCSSTRTEAATRV